MLALKTFSARRYRVVGRLPSPYDEEFHRRLDDRRFRPLAPGEERTVGWVTADNLLVTTFDVDTVVRGEHAVLALRIDNRRANPRLVRARLDLETEARRKASRDAGKPLRLSREERQQMRSDVQAELLRTTNPSVEVHTVLVQPKRRLVTMLGLGRTANETLVRLFHDTFAVDLAPLTPWRRAQEVLAGTTGLERLDGLARSAFVPPDEAPPRRQAVAEEVT